MVQTVSFSIKISSFQENASQRLEATVNYFLLKIFYLNEALRIILEIFWLKIII